MGETQCKAHCFTRVKALNKPCILYQRNYEDKMKVRAIAIGTLCISLFNLCVCITLENITRVKWKCVQSPLVLHLIPYSIVCVYYIRKYHAGQMKVRAIARKCLRLAHCLTRMKALNEPRILYQRNDESKFLSSKQKNSALKTKILTHHFAGIVYGVCSRPSL